MFTNLEEAQQNYKVWFTFLIDWVWYPAFKMAPMILASWCSHPCIVFCDINHIGLVYITRRIQQRTSHKRHHSFCFPFLDHLLWGYEVPYCKDTQLTLSRCQCGRKLRHPANSQGHLARHVNKSS